MVSATYGSIQARVETRVIDLPPPVLAEVPTLVNEAIEELQRRHNFKVMETELPAYTSQGNRGLVVSVGGGPLAIPSNFKEFNGEPYYVRFSDGSVRFMTIAPDRYSIWNAFTEGATSQQAIDIGFPAVILDAPGDDTGNRFLQVYPIPDGLSDYTDGEYRIVIPYYRYVAPLINDSDNNWFTNQSAGARFIMEWATAEAFSIDWDLQHEQEHKAKAELEYNLLVKADKIYRVSAVNELAIHWQGVHNNRTRL